MVTFVLSVVWAHVMYRGHLLREAQSFQRHVHDALLAELFHQGTMQLEVVAQSDAPLIGQSSSSAMALSYLLPRNLPLSVLGL